MIKQLRTQSSVFPKLLFFVLPLVTLLFYLSVTWAWSMPAAVEVEGWTATTALPEGLALRNVVTHGDFLYTIGGKGVSAAPLAAIRGARINADGSLGTWNLVGQLPVALYLHTAVVAEDALYVVGGWDGGQTRNEVWRGVFNADGSVGSWLAMPAYPLALDLHDGVYLNGRIYVVGGWDSEQSQRAIYQAVVNRDGLGAWQLAGELPVPLYRLAVTGANGNLYVTGGYNSNGATNAVYVAALNGDGTLAPWQSGTGLPNALYYHKALMQDGRLVVLGGRNDSTVFSDVRIAAIGANGVPGSWQAAPALPAAIFRFGATSVTRNGSDFIYVVGGLRSETEYQQNVYHSTVPAPPTPTPTATPTATPIPPLRSLNLDLDNRPSNWVAPGSEVTYRVAYANPNSEALNDVTITDLVPNGVELVPESVRGDRGVFSAGGTQSGAVITWQLGSLNAGATGSLSYRVRRPVPPTPVVPLALTIDIAGPATAAPGAEVVYTFTVTNRSPIVLNNLVITNTLPVGSAYVRGAQGIPNARTVQWNLASLAANATAQVSYVVKANESLVNYDYRVSSSPGPTTRGQALIVTLVNNQTPRHGDLFALLNDGVGATWDLQGRSNEIRSNSVANPSYNLYLPNVQR